MTLSSKKSSKAPPPSFLTKLSTLRDFVNGMGVNASESQLSDTLKNSGYNVELALERILTGNFGSAAGGGDVGGSGVPSSSSSSVPASAKKRGGSSTASSSTSARTPKSSIKRHKSGSSVTSSSSSSIRKSSSGIKKSSHAHDQNQNHPATNRLLLCKRWSVACSKSTRGKVDYGESLDFTENWSKNNGKKSCTSITPKKGSGNSTNNKPIDPMVRFHSSSGYVEGTLNRYLCSILSPLIHLPATNNCNSEGEFIPLVSIEGEALMEDRSLVIGSEIPISLQIYINDPLAFFELFQQSRGDSGTAGEEASTSSKLFFQKKNKKNGGDSKLPSYQGKKAKSSFTEEELAEAAYHLLQWAERGEELPFTKEKSNAVEKTGKDNNSEVDSINDDGDGDYEDNNSVASEVDELNQLVASQEDCNKVKMSLPELKEPEGFKSVTLRPYQRQALYWMCKREGCYVEGEMTKEDSEDDVNGELDLLAELASSTNSNNNSDGSIQVWGGKAISCDCGPAVVSDEDVASKALPVVQYDQKQGENESKYAHHPLWKRRFLASDDMTTVCAFYVNELLGIASASPPNPPKQCVGGILADAMGLGKTVMLLSLILKTKEAAEAGAVITGKESVGVDVPKKSERITKRKAATAPKDADVVDLSFDGDDSDQSETDQQMDDDESWTEGQNNNIATNKPRFKGRQSKGAGSTLVIAPLSLIAQWEEELASKTTDLSHLVYYDSSKKATGAEVFSCVDVVVTTYGSVQSEYASLARSIKTNNGSIEPSHSHPLLKHDWKRVILDEAHGIKNTGTVVSKACCMLKADTRWCVTGTPIQNSLQDVYGLLKFLRHEPWCEATFWKNAITNSLSAASNGTGNASAMANNNEDDKEEGPSPQALAVSAAFGRVKRVLAPIILRRTKDTLTEDGTPILTLPPIESSVINVSLSDPEREFYNALLERSQSVFEGFLNNGTAAKSWFAIFSLLQRLRQACDHVSLTVKKNLDTGEETKLKHSGGVSRARSSSSNVGGEDTIDDSFLHGLLNKFKKKSSSVSNSNGEPTSFAAQVAESLTQCIQASDEYMKAECPICLDEPRVEDAVHTPCAHMFHRDCLLDLFKQTGSSKKGKVEGGSCPVCNEWVQTSRIIQIEKSEDGDVVSKYLNQLPEYEKENSPNSEVLQRDAAARETLESALNGANSSKLEAILNELDEIWKQDPGSKILIFSQYLGFLDIIGRAMDDVGVECFRIDGKMSLKERVAMIDKFNKNAPPKQDDDETCQRGSVFLVSMKAGGVGLNLVAASSVFITDHWWNQAIEDQCINRIHRIGQQAKVVRVRKFVVSDSVEEKIVNLQGKKKGMANEILNDTDGGGDLDSTKPTLEDFKLLFGR